MYPAAIPGILAPVSDAQPRNPLHGVTLEALLGALVDRYGWSGLASRISIRCFTEQPNLPSCLNFLRKTAWARAKVEQLYLDDLRVAERHRKRNKRRAAMRAHRAAQEGAGPAAAGDAADDAGAADAAADAADAAADAGAADGAADLAERDDAGDPDRAASGHADADDPPGAPGPAPAGGGPPEA